MGCEDEWMRILVTNDDGIDSIGLHVLARSICELDGDHDIDCKIDGIGAMKLKSEFVKKA